MVDEANGAAGGPPSYPGGSSEGGSAVPPPPPLPPTYPSAQSGGYAPPQGVYPPPTYGGATGVPYASWGLRLGGFLIDLVILAVIQGILNAVLRRSNSLAVHYTMTRNGTVHHQTLSILALIIGILVAVIYNTVLIGSPGGKTVGMMAVGVRCVRDVSHDQVGYGKALGRSVLERVFFILFPVWIADMLWPLWDKERQTLHDKVVSTVVLRTRNPM